MKKITLFCVPYAGASAMVYKKWEELLHNSIELVPLELAGRGFRYKEPHYNSFDDVINDLSQKIANRIDGHDTFALFGHSMGSTIIYELTYRLKDLINESPKVLFFSGNIAPHVKKQKKMIHLLGEQEFKEEVYRYGITPKEVFEDKTLYQFFMPTLRNDFRINETYQFCKKKMKIDCPISVFYGSEDEKTNKYNMLEWSKHTKFDCSFYKFNGGHFFIHEHYKEIVEIINKSLIANNSEGALEI